MVGYDECWHTQVHIELDICLAATSQIVKEQKQLKSAIGLARGMVEPGGIEPPTPCLQSRCSPS